MTTITLRIRHLILAIALAVVIGSVGMLATLMLLDRNPTSEESHLVLNYIMNNHMSGHWEADFNTVNGNWPASRRKLAELLLSAHQEVALRQSTSSGQ